MPEYPIERYTEPQPWDAVQCLLCPHQCSVAPSRQGRCGVRANRNGRLVATNYGKVSRAELTPAEDLPLFHFLPGSRWYRVASVGCTMSCPFCNTARYSQVAGARVRNVEPAALAAEAKAAGAAGLFFGINEPAVWHEYILAAGEAAHAQGLFVGAETSGMWSTEPFSHALEVLDVVVFGFKGFDTAMWSNEFGGMLEQTRLNLELALDRNRHVEASYLVIEGRTDAPDQAGAFAHWLAELSPMMAVHALGYEPAFQWTQPATPLDAVRAAIAEMSRHLAYVYGRVEAAGVSRETRCASCGRTVVTRSAITGVTVQNLKDRQCAGCGARLPLVF